mgnify:CR=1 FL=1
MNCDPEFSEIAQGFLCGDVTEHGVLSDAQKALIRMVALTACQTLKPLARYTLSALDVGATPEQIKETLYQCAPYIGLEMFLPNSAQLPGLDLTGRKGKV